MSSWIREFLTCCSTDPSLQRSRSQSEASKCTRPSQNRSGQRQRVRSPAHGKSNDGSSLNSRPSACKKRRRSRKQGRMKSIKCQSPSKSSQKLNRTNRRRKGLLSRQPLRTPTLKIMRCQCSRQPVSRSSHDFSQRNLRRNLPTS